MRGNLHKQFLSQFPKKELGRGSFKMDIAQVEKIPSRVIKMITGLKYLSYEESLKDLKNFCLKKIVKGRCDKDL